MLSSHFLTSEQKQQFSRARFEARIQQFRTLADHAKQCASEEQLCFLQNLKEQVHITLYCLMYTGRLAAEMYPDSGVLVRLAIVHSCEIKEAVYLQHSWGVPIQHHEQGIEHNLLCHWIYFTYLLSCWKEVLRTWGSYKKLFRTTLTFHFHSRSYRGSTQWVCTSYMY